MTKSKLWLPTPDPEKIETSMVRGRIMDAKYNKLEGCITVYVACNGSNRTAVIHKSTLKFHGKSFESVPESELDREMETTAALFRKAKGRHVRIQMDKNQE